MRRNQEVTGDIDKAYDKASADGKRFIEAQADHKNDVMGMYTLAKGIGSAMMNCRPNLRGVLRKGRMVWTRL